MPTEKNKLKVVVKKPTKVKETKVKETKVQTFKRIVEPRVLAVLSKIRILGNCSNQNNYEYTTEQVVKIFSKIQESLDNAMNLFTKSKKEIESFEL